MPQSPRCQGPAPHASRSWFTSFTLAVGLGLLAAALSACSKTSVGSHLAATSTARIGACDAGLIGAQWCEEYQQRSRELAAYLGQEAGEFSSFVNAPLGNHGFPAVLLLLAPELFPDVVAAQGPGFDRLGLSANPWQSGARLPRGLGVSEQKLVLPGGFSAGTGIQVATLSCGACHVGQVRGPDGKVVDLVGAGNSHFDSTGLFALFAAIVRHPNFTAEKVRTAVAAKPAGWFYGDPDSWSEAGERALYTNLTEQLLSGVKKSVLDGHDQQDLMINQQGYAKSGGLNYFSRTPGRADATALTTMLFLDKDHAAEMPQTPTITKIMSVWRQDQRVVTHWTADMPAGVDPVVAGEIAVASDAQIVNRENITHSLHLMDKLPPPPYPFAVDSAKAKVGERLYADNCASCHRNLDGTVYPAAEVGTDPARLRALSASTYKSFDAALHQGCPQPELSCTPDEKNILRPREAVQGYVATPLDGIWARAPYLHNGSVPTLFHLLVPSQRPVQFIVGSLDFDPVMVGFDWEHSSTNTEVYRVGALSQRATGHDTPAYLGRVDWEHDAASREALIEYMKTL